LSRPVADFGGAKKGFRACRIRGSFDTGDFWERSKVSKARGYYLCRDFCLHEKNEREVYRASIP